MTSAANVAERDVINSATPIEGRLLGVHPRLYLDAAGFERLCQPNQPRATRRALDSLIAVATQSIRPQYVTSANTPGDHRGQGHALGCLALAWKITGERRFFDATIACAEAFRQWQSWGDDLQFGHTAYGFALALDWLWHDIAPAQRDSWIDTLHRHAAHVFDEWRSYRSGTPFSYLWNHHTVPLAGLTSAAAALYGERPGIAPWWNMAVEKARCITAALDDDGVAAESMAYGAYFSHYLMKTVLLTRRLIGVDLLCDVAWWRNYPLALIHHALPRRHWTYDSTFLMLGDSPGQHWYGPDAVCRICAGEFDDGRAQWLAEALDEANVCATPQERIMMLDSMKPDLPAAPPDDLPTMARFDELGLVIGRSAWSGDESMFGFLCGPSMGRSASRQFNHPVAGGHMHAFAGTFQVFSHGEKVIAPAGYTFKWTKYHNTVLINGRGQLGEGGAWFEDLPFRQGHACPTLIASHSTPEFDYVAGNAQPAYPDELGVHTFVRHLVFIKPDVWAIIDVLETQAPATFAQLFHTPFALRPAGPRQFTGQGATASLTVRALHPQDVAGRTETQEMLYTGGNPTHTLELLTLENSTPTARATFVTMLATGPASAPPHLDDADVTCADSAITLSLRSRKLRVRVDSAGGIQSLA